MNYDIVLAIICVLFGYLIGRLHGSFKQPATIEENSEQTNYKTRQINKIRYVSDSDRIKELNALSAIESNLYRLIKNGFPDFEVTIKSKRFFVVDADGYPIAIFEYHAGRQKFKAVSEEDGVPIFIYKAQFNSTDIKEAATQVIAGHRRSAS